MIYSDEKKTAVYKQIPGADIEEGWYAYWTYADGSPLPDPCIIAGPFRYKREAERAARTAANLELKRRRK